ncbi:MAG: tetratricopeptide repeat protein, partial [Planctomycetota bacterium]|nr:tetratricopeptide repeat protein [Planctomycetota bacterium]
MTSFPTVRRLAPLLFLFLIPLAPAAGYGDFLLPDEPGREAAGLVREGGQSLSFTLPGGGEMEVYLASAGEAEPGRILASLAARLALELPVEIMDLGGRPWFGNRNALSDGLVLYHGYVRRNQAVYSVSFTLRGICAPDADVRRILCRLQLFPGLWSPSAAAEAPEQLRLGKAAAAEAAELLRLGETEAIPAWLQQMESKAAARWWVTPYFQGRLADLGGDYAAARDAYARALELFPGDGEIAARLYGAASLAGEMETGVEALQRLGESDPDNHWAWEELAKIYLMAGEAQAGRDYLEAALAANPASWTALTGLAHLDAGEGRYADAFRRSREILRYWPWTPGETLPDLAGGAAELTPLLSEILREPPYGGTIAFFNPLPAAWSPDGCAASPLPGYVQAAPAELLPAPAAPPVYLIQPPPIQVIEAPAIRTTRLSVLGLILDIFRPDGFRSERGHHPPAQRPPPHRPPSGVRSAGGAAGSGAPGRLGGADRPRGARPESRPGENRTPA